MLKAQQISARLLAASYTATNRDLLMEAAAALDGDVECIESLAAYIAGQTSWKIPLSDGVMAEVKISGKHSIEHVHTFAKIFSVIAENYKAPALSDSTAATVAGTANENPESHKSTPEAK